LRYSRLIIGMAVLALIASLTLFDRPASAESNPVVLMFDVAGNTKTPAEKILGVISKTKIGAPLNSQAVQSDMQAIMEIGYFADVQVKSEKFLNGVKLVFMVVENPIFKEVRITGLTKLKPEELQPMFTQKSGEVFNTATFRNDLTKIKQYCRDKKGLYINEKIKGGLTADGVINLELVELKVGKIKIVGLEKTKEFVVTRELSLKEGDIFDNNQVKEDYFALTRLRLFETIEPKVEMSAIPDSLDLVFQVKEAATGSFQIGASYSESSAEIGGLLVFSEDNLMGLGQSLSLDMNVTESGKDISFSFYDPWLDKKGTSFRLTVYNSDTETTSTMNKWKLNTDMKSGVDGGAPNSKYFYENLSSDYPYDIDLIRTGLQMSFGRRLWKNTTGRLKLNFEKNQITDIYYDRDNYDDDKDDKKDTKLDNTAKYEVAGGSKYGEEFWDNSLGLELVRNRLQYDGRFFVKGGYQLTGSYSVAGRYLGGEFNYQSTVLDGRWFRTLAPNLVFGTRLQGAYLSGSYPDYDALYLGGMNRLRGWDDSRYGSVGTKSLIGSGYLLSNTELRYRLPANKSLEFVLFYDAGQLNGSDSEFKYDYGVGLRYEIPFLGLLRLDQAWNSDSDKKIVISLGELF
jgi:outer membrane protein insertion porin family